VHVSGCIACAAPTSGSATSGDRARLFKLDGTPLYSVDLDATGRFSFDAPVPSQYEGDYVFVARRHGCAMVRTARVDGRVAVSPEMPDMLFPFRRDDAGRCRGQRPSMNAAIAAPAGVPS
jgi:hypothetical protein